MKNILIKLKRLFCLCAVSRSLLSDDEIRHALENSIKKYNINDTTKEIWIDGAKWMRDYILKPLEPVPLTEEWLIKFGFINDEEIGYRWYIEWEGCVILAYDLDDKGIRVSDTWEFGKREYVHQLQNLYFALTGCELQYVA